MNTFLWTLSLVGAWNAINLIARVYCRVVWHNYLWSVVVGTWASYLLFIQQ